MRFQSIDYSDLSQRCVRMLRTFRGRSCGMTKADAERHLSQAGCPPIPSFLDFLRRFSKLTIPHRRGCIEFERKGATAFRDRSSGEWRMFIANEPDSSLVGQYLDSQGRVELTYDSGHLHSVIVSESLVGFLERTSLEWEAKERNWSLTGFPAPTPDAARIAAEELGLRSAPEASDAVSKWWAGPEVVIGSEPAFERRHRFLIAVDVGAASSIDRLWAVAQAHIEPHVFECRLELSSTGVDPFPLEPEIDIPALHRNYIVRRTTRKSHSFRVACCNGLRALGEPVASAPDDPESLRAELLDRWTTYRADGRSELLYFAGVGLMALGELEKGVEGMLSNAPETGSVAWGGRLWPLCFLHWLFHPAADETAQREFSPTDKDYWKTWIADNRSRLIWNVDGGTYMMT